MPSQEKKKLFSRALLWKVWTLVGLYWFFVFQFIDGLPYAAAYFLTEFGFYMMWIIALFSVAILGLPFLKVVAMSIRKIREVEE